tara:strand:+ start:5755 stop:6195 length:441 start_codon:yes stop_codon:yes gene_type:complete
MIHWNNLSALEKTDLWRQERENLKKLNYVDRLQSLSTFFSHVPYGSRTIDYYTPSNWLSPWEILHYGTFCRSSISLLMFHTLTIVDPEINIKLSLIDDKEDIFLVVVVDDTFVLGYIPGEVVKLTKIKKSVQIKQTFQNEQIKTFA